MSHRPQFNTKYIHSKCLREVKNGLTCSMKALPDQNNQKGAIPFGTKGGEDVFPPFHL